MFIISMITLGIYRLVTRIKACKKARLRAAEGYKEPEPEVEGAKDIAVEFHSFSKTFNMAGWRVGFVCGKQEFIDVIYAMKTNMDYGTSTIVQDAAISALNCDIKHVQEIMDKYKWVNFVFGTHNLHRLPYLLNENFKSNKSEIEVFSYEGNIVEGMPVKRDSKYKAFVNIIYGCDKFCTYCIVPYTRGKQRSRLPEDIIDEVREMYNNCYQEVTLLGQNVNSYSGLDENGQPVSFAKLLKDKELNLLATIDYDEINSENMMEVVVRDTALWKIFVIISLILLFAVCAKFSTTT